jgi:hypothetical protein
MTDIRIVVPLGELEWLEEELFHVADAEGPEEEGDSQVYFVADLTGAEVQDVLAKLLIKTGTAGAYRVVLDEDPGRIVVKPVRTAQWLTYPLGAESAYERALKRECKRISEDREWASWWSQAPFATLYFHVSTETHPWMWLETKGSLLVEARFPDQDLMIADVEKPDRHQLRTVTERQLHEILRRTGEWLRLPTPETGVGSSWSARVGGWRAPAAPRGQPRASAQRRLTARLRAARRLSERRSSSLTPPHTP